MTFYSPDACAKSIRLQKLQSAIEEKPNRVFLGEFSSVI